MLSGGGKAPARARAPHLIRDGRHEEVLGRDAVQSGYGRNAPHAGAAEVALPQHLERQRRVRAHVALLRQRARDRICAQGGLVSAAARMLAQPPTKHAAGRRTCHHAPRRGRGGRVLVELHHRHVPTEGLRVPELKHGGVIKNRRRNGPAAAAVVLVMQRAARDDVYNDGREATVAADV